MDGWMDGWCAGGCWFTLACNKGWDVNIYVCDALFSSYVTMVVVLWSITTLWSSSHQPLEILCM